MVEKVRRPDIAASIVAKELGKILGVGISSRYKVGGAELTDSNGIIRQHLDPGILEALRDAKVLRALAAEISRRWLEVEPEIFLDVASNRIGLRTPYNPQLIEELKQFIPGGARSWEPTTKTWYLNVSYLESIEVIIRKFYPGVKVTTPEQLLPAKAAGCYAELLEPLPEFALRAAYRGILLAVHPDRAKSNGLSPEAAHEMILKVQAAWKKIAKERSFSA